MVPSFDSCERCLLYVPLLILPHWSWSLLWFQGLVPGLIFGSLIILGCNSFCFSGLCPALRSNIFLGRNSYHLIAFCVSLCWLLACLLALGWFLSERSYS